MTYDDALIDAVREWKKNPIDDEWAFESFRQRHVETLSSEEAFRAIDRTLTILVREPDESTSTELLQTVIALARKSDTTEVPRNLKEHRATLQTKFDHYGNYAKNKLEELFRFYRLNEPNEPHEPTNEI
jgi:hypothetical protein